MGLLTFCRKKGANSVNNDLHLLTAMMWIDKAAEFLMIEA